MKPIITTATAPAKAILLGEHAVNRGQAALAVSVGLSATCTVRYDPAASEPRYEFVSARHTATTTREAVLAIGRMVDLWRESEDYAAIQRFANSDFFGPTQYVLAAFGEVLPPSLAIHFESEIPPSAGLGSGGASFVALVGALARLLELEPSARQLAAWARRGDVVAHGGIASGLDTQTSLYGGVIRYTADREGEPIPYDPSLRIVIGNTGLVAETSKVNGRVRRWLEERPARLHYFQEIGLLSRLAEVAVREGDWPALGRLLNLNQLVLERIGVSCPELERLNEAALAAGALGAKLSGSGGGGIMIALVMPETIDAVSRAIAEVGGRPIVAPIAVPGVTVRDG